MSFIGFIVKNVVRILVHIRYLSTNSYKITGIRTTATLAPFYNHVLVNVNENKIKRYIQTLFSENP